MALLDLIAALVTARRPFFSRGLGDRKVLDWALSPTPIEGAAPIALHWEPDHEVPGGLVRRGSLPSPLAERLPEASRTALVELWSPSPTLGAHSVCLHLAASGDEGFARRRRLFARPLLRRGVASLILENPMYGARRPSRGPGTTVADLAVMARAAMEEALALIAWLAGAGVARIQVTGVSMGAQVAAMAAALSPLEISVVPCLPSRSPAEVFVDGMLSRAVDWPALERELGRDARVQMRDLLARGDVLDLPPPRRPAAAILVGARHDAIVRPSSAGEIHRHWPGSELRVLATSHVGAVVLHARALRRAMTDALDRL